MGSSNKNGLPIQENNSKKKQVNVNGVTAPKDGSKISAGLKSLATSTLTPNVAAQRALLSKKPEGIQISRSKHWKFISSYHGPYYLNKFPRLMIDGSNCPPSSLRSSPT